MSGLVCGSLGASRIGDATARTKSGWSASRANLMAELVVERLTGQPYETYINAAMQRGIEIEPQARAAYEFETGQIVTQTDPVLHPTIAFSHASPDGFIGHDALVELKCPNSSTHIDSLLGAEIDGRYFKQCQWQMAVTGRQWCDFVSFDPRLPEEMRLFIRRIPRDEDAIRLLTIGVVEFLEEVDQKVADLKMRYDKAKIA